MAQQQQQRQQQAADAIVCSHNAIQRGLRGARSGRQIFMYQPSGDMARADQQSVQCLVNHLRSHSVRDLFIHDVRFSEEGFNVFLAHLASITTVPLRTLHLVTCDVGPPERVSQLVTAIRTNASVTDFKIVNPEYEDETIQNATLDSDILVGLLEKNNPHLQKLCLNEFILQLGNADALRRALGNIPHLTELDLFDCNIDDAGFQVITDGLVGNPADGVAGNTTLEVLNISWNLAITANAFLVNGARLLQWTQLKTLKYRSANNTLNNEATARPFAHALATNSFIKTLDLYGVTLSSSVAVIILQALVGNTALENLELGRIEQGDDLQLVVESLPVMTALKRLTLTQANAWNLLIQNQSFVPSLYQNTSLEELTGLDLERYPQFDAIIRSIQLILARNRSMKRVALLLQPLPGTDDMIPENNLSWRRAMFRLAGDHILSGATPIFHLLRSHPVILESITPAAPRRRQQQQQAVTRQRAAIEQQDNSDIDHDNNQG